MCFILKLCINADLGRFVECVSGSTLLSLTALLSQPQRCKVLLKEVALHASLKYLNTEMIAEYVMWRKVWCTKSTVLTPFIIFVVLLSTKLWFLYWSLDEISTERLELEGVCSAEAFISHTLVAFCVVYC